jgi:hypothetical protein
MFKLTEEEVAINNYNSQQVYENLIRKINKFNTDPFLDIRLADQECKSCYYILNDRISLHVFTDYNCRNCGLKSSWHNSQTPKYCSGCSDEHGTCKRCGARV